MCTDYSGIYLFAARMAAYFILCGQFVPFDCQVHVFAFMSLLFFFYHQTMIFFDIA